MIDGTLLMPTSRIFALAFILAVVALLADLIGRMRLQLEELVYESRRERINRLLARDQK